MLQFVTVYPHAKSLLEQVEEVLDGGCRWIEISAPGMSEEDLRKAIEEIVPLCKEVNAFVVTRDHLGLAAEFRLHGIFVDFDADPRKIREELGGEAIIGVKVSSYEQVFNLKAADVDYLTFELHSAEGRDRAVKAVKKAREEGIKMPIVAQGEFSIPEMQELLHDGFSGLALSKTLIEAERPEVLTQQILSQLMP